MKRIDARLRRKRGEGDHRSRRPLAVLAAAIGALVVLAGCSGVEVSQDFRKNADFSGISSFAWESQTQKETGDVRIDNPLLDERIRTAVQQNLAAKGIEKTERGVADIWVRYQLQSRQQVRSNDVGGGFGFGIGTYGSGGGISVGTGGNVRTYEYGFLAIDLIRPKSGELLWRGTATFQFPDHLTPEQTTERIDTAVSKTLEQFPPGPS